MGLKTQGNFVPYDLAGSRQDTATLLVGTAREFGLVVRHHVASAQGGYYISNELADVLYDEDESDAGEAEPETEVSGNKAKAAKPAKKTSGNRAGKNNEE